MPTLKKIYYVPGLISAVLIPLLFWYYASQRAHTPYTVLDLGLPAKHKLNDSMDNTLESYRNWNYKKIIVKPNNALQNQKYYISELKKLQKKNEKETGIEFVINDKNNLQDFIALMNAMAWQNRKPLELMLGILVIFLLFTFIKIQTNAKVEMILLNIRFIMRNTIIKDIKNLSISLNNYPNKHIM